MNKSTLVLLLAGLGLLLTQSPLLAGMALPRATDKQYVQDQILVKFKPGVAAAASGQLAQTYGAQAMQTLGNQPDWMLAKLPPGQTVEHAVDAYNNDPNVEYAQPDYIYRALTIPNDPQYGQLWAAKNTGQTVATGKYYPTAGTAGNDMNLESAWNVKTDCSSVVIAVVDTGVNYNSTDLSANMWTGNAIHGQNFAADGAAGDPMDLDGHGTHVAGIIGAAGNNSTGGTGVCWKAKLMAVRVLDATGTGYTSTIIQGIGYAVSNNAKVINMSLGGNGSFDQAFSNAITNAQNNNVLVLAAAGNDSANNDATPTWPCNFSHANLICVTALDQNYALAYFSNWGATKVDVGAPGTNIYSPWAGTNSVIKEFIEDVTPTGWLSSSTTAGTGGGWGVETIGGGQATGRLIDPKTSWGTTLYNANTDDRTYKTFNLAGSNAAILKAYTAINVKNGDFFNVNYKNAGGDPFAGGTNIFAVTNRHDGINIHYSGEINITPCISATCTVGVQLLSGATLPKDSGVALRNLSITTLTLNSTSYNTIDGTSMATPEVAGVAALVWAHNPLYTYADVANAIKKGGRSIPALSGKTTSGKAVDAMGALSYINPPTGIAVNVQ